MPNLEPEQAVAQPVAFSRRAAVKAIGAIAVWPYLSDRSGGGVCRHSGDSGAAAAGVPDRRAIPTLDALAETHHPRRRSFAGRAGRARRRLHRSPPVRVGRPDPEGVDGRPGLARRREPPAIQGALRAADAAAGHGAAHADSPGTKPARRRRSSSSSRPPRTRPSAGTTPRRSGSRRSWNTRATGFSASSSAARIPNTATSRPSRPRSDRARRHHAAATRSRAAGRRRADGGIPEGRGVHHARFGAVRRHRRRVRRGRRHGRVPARDGRHQGAPARGGADARSGARVPDDGVAVCEHAARPAPGGRVRARRRRIQHDRSACTARRGGSRSIASCCRTRATPSRTTGWSTRSRIRRPARATRGCAPASSAARPTSGAASRCGCPTTTSRRRAATGSARLADRLRGHLAVLRQGRHAARHLRHAARTCRSCPTASFSARVKLNCGEQILKKAIAKMGRHLIPGRAGVTTDGVANKYRDPVRGPRPLRARLRLQRLDALADGARFFRRATPAT